MHKDRGVIFILTILGLSISLVVMTYLIILNWHILTPNENGNFTYSKADLGTIGDLIGGILNPVLTFVTIVLLLWSIRIQVRELSAATEQSRRSASALEQTHQIHEQNLREQKHVAMIPILTAKLREESSLLYEVYRKEVNFSYKESDKSDGPKIDGVEYIKVRAGEAPSLLSLQKSATGTEKLSMSVFAFIREDSKKEAMRAVSNRINHVYHIIKEVVYVCEKFHQIGADELLYRDEIHQASFINSSLIRVITSINGEIKDDNRHKALDLRIGKLVNNKLKTAIINEDGRTKPFTIVF